MTSKTTAQLLEAQLEAARLSLAQLEQDFKVGLIYRLGPTPQLPAQVPGPQGHAAAVVLCFFVNSAPRASRDVMASLCRVTLC